MGRAADPAGRPRGPELRTARRRRARGRPAGGRAAAPALFERGAITRSFDTPGFRGMTFFEVHARSVINRVPDSSRMPFRWTINPYRGCSHACVYCFARNSHTYLDLDAGHDFDSKIVVKVNAPALVRKELNSRKWQGEHIAMGTNVDVYQRAEGKYQLMPGILQALLDARNPYSDPDQGHADPPRPRPAAGVRGGHRRGPQRVGRLRRRGPVADARAGHAQPPAAAGRLRHAQRARAALRGADGPGRAVPVRLPGPAGVHRAADRRGGRHPRQPRSCCTCGPGPGSGSWPGWASITRTWSPATGGCTVAGPTRPRTTSSGSPGRSASSRSATTSGAAARRRSQRTWRRAAPPAPPEPAEEQLTLL